MPNILNTCEPDNLDSDLSMIFEAPGAVVTSTNGKQAEAWMPVNRVAV